MAIRINPSKMAITVWDGITFLHILEINIGSSMNIPIAMIKEKIITTVIRMLSNFSPNTLSSHCSKRLSFASSSSSKKLQDQVSALMPTIMESANLNTPLIKGIPKNGYFFVTLL